MRAGMWEVKERAPDRARGKESCTKAKIRNGLAPTHPWEIQKEALGGACPLEEVQDEAFQEVAEVVAAPQSPEAQHGGVLGHGGHGGPAASGTSLDGASHLVGTGEDVSVRDRDVQPLESLLLGGHVLQPQVA